MKWFLLFCAVCACVAFCGCFLLRKKENRELPPIKVTMTKDHRFRIFGKTVNDIPGLQKYVHGEKEACREDEEIFPRVTLGIIFEDEEATLYREIEQVLMLAMKEKIWRIKLADCYFELPRDQGPAVLDDAGELSGKETFLEVQEELEKYFNELTTVKKYAHIEIGEITKASFLLKTLREIKKLGCSPIFGVSSMKNKSGIKISGFSESEYFIEVEEEVESEG